jgi:hypothetical protein
MVAGFLAIGLSVSGTALADPSKCNPPGKLLVDIVNNWKSTEKNPLVQRIEQAIQFLNGIAGGGPATLGPRPLLVNKVLSGTVVPPGDRVFINAFPMPEDTLTVKIDKLEGKAKTDVNICKIDPETQVASSAAERMEFDKAKDTESRQVSVSGMKGRIPMVFLDGQGLGTKFEYNLTVNAQLPK